ncbi:hypothetical protein LINPERHAP1_LOCUS29671, partial [Linum perenne]
SFTNLHYSSSEANYCVSGLLITVGGASSCEWSKCPIFPRLYFQTQASSIHTTEFTVTMPTITHHDNFSPSSSNSPYFLHYEIVDRRLTEVFS